MNESKWNVDSLHELMDERDKRYEQRFKGQEEAVKVAVTVIETRLAGMNEWRQTITDQTATYMPRPEAEQRATTNSKDIAGLVSRMDRMESKGAGLNAMWGYVVAAIVTGISVLSFFQNR